MIYNYTPDVKSICVVDENNELLQQYRDCTPDFQQLINMSEDDSGEYDPQKVSLWWDMKVEEIGKETQLLSGEAIRAYFWYVEPLPDSTQKLCVKMPFMLYEYETMSCVTSVLVCLAFMVLVLAWNIYMIVRAVRERRREKDILYTSTVTGGRNIQYFKDQAEEILINTVRKLRNYGFEVSMDDFGAGYSSLNSLKELPLDVLKLDMRIVAEGIETREQVDFLAEKNCDLIQGYYFAKPMSVEEFEKLVYGEK